MPATILCSSALQCWTPQGAPHVRNPKEANCFVIAPIGAPERDTRKRSDQVLEYVFKEALGEQYDVTRADKITEPGIITSQIIRLLQDSELVLADLTEHNPNVFYELAVRPAIKKPVIHVIDSHLKIPFDIVTLRVIAFDYTDLASVANAKKQLRDQAAEIQAGKLGETPIDIATIMRPSKQDSQDTVLLKEVVLGITELRAQLNTQMSNLAYLNRVLLPAASLSPTFAGAALSVDTENVFAKYANLNPQVSPIMVQGLEVPRNP